MGYHSEFGKGCFFLSGKVFRIPEVKWGGGGGRGDLVGGWIGREYVRYKELGMVKRGMFG